MGKKVLLIATGGTIASKGTNSGLTPLLTSEDILEFLPETATKCQVDTVQLCNLDSTNIGPMHWIQMEQMIEKNYQIYDGFIICHGTDTMAYTAAALSYLIQNSEKPIIITGSQKPIDEEITDAKKNLADSFTYAVSNTASGVQIVFGGKVITGTRARKTRTKSYNAFSSINYPNLAVIQDGKIMQYISEREPKQIDFFHKMNTKVGLFKLIPGTSAEYLDFLLDKNDAVIIESYGVGGIPSLEEDHFYERIREWIRKGKTVVMTTQVPNEGSDMTIYRVGHQLKEKLNVLEAYDMTTEAVLTKLMWILGQTKMPERIKDLFYTTISHDILYVEGKF